MYRQSNQFQNRRADGAWETVRVPVVWPEDDDGEGPDAPAMEAAGRREVVTRLLQILTDGATDPATVGERAVILASVALPDFHAKSLRELGRVLGCSHTEARRRVTVFLREVAKMSE